MSDVYLVDDHVLMRDSLRAVLQDAGHRVVGESANPTQALAELQVLTPAVLVLDLNLGSRSGFELLEQLRDRMSTVRTIVLTMSAQPRDIAEAQRLGALGYMLKGSPARALLDAVEAVLGGRSYVAKELAPFTFDQSAALTGGLASLSARERQVVFEVVNGRSSSEIGDLLNLSPKTVDSYRSRLMTKLGVADVPALVRLAVREGWIDV
jgi:two-component system, NarL family, invasion response regulator UvrY